MIEAFGFFHYFFSFILIISVLVFVHEYGHYAIARLCGVKVETFSLGMGPKMFSFKDKSGTDWIISALPIGGYVKMFGDAGAASTPDFKRLKNFNKKQKSESFYFKNPYQKLAIVLGGPLANYLFAILLFAGLFLYTGVMKIEPVILGFTENSVAKSANLQVGDRILKIDSTDIYSFTDIQKYLSLHSHQSNFSFLILREGEKKLIKISPIKKYTKNLFGEDIKIAYIGVIAGEFKRESVGFFRAIGLGVKESFEFSQMTLTAISQIILGKRSLDSMGGPIKIGKYSGESTKKNFVFVMWFLAVLSVNLGLLNLLPIPLLDGGHAVFYIYEIITGNEVKKTVQVVLFKLGFALLVSLFILVTTNDILGLMRS